MRPIDADAFVKVHIEKAENFHAMGQDKLSEFNYTLASIVGNEYFAPTIQMTEFPAWIPVSHHLPREGQEVLTLRNGHYHIEFYSARFKWAFDGVYNPVTHWMPLPPKPEVNPDE